MTSSWVILNFTFGIFPLKGIKFAPAEKHGLILFRSPGSSPKLWAKRLWFLHSNLLCATWFLAILSHLFRTWHHCGSKSYKHRYELIQKTLFIFYSTIKLTSAYKQSNQIT